MFVRIISINAQCTANWFDAYSISKNKSCGRKNMNLLTQKAVLSSNFQVFMYPLILVPAVLRLIIGLDLLRASEKGKNQFS